MRLYLREIGRVPLLNREGEVTLPGVSKTERENSEDHHSFTGSHCRALKMAEELKDGRSQFVIWWCSRGD